MIIINDLHIYKLSFAREKCIYRPTQNELITNDIKVSKIYDARESLKLICGIMCNVSNKHFSFFLFSKTDKIILTNKHNLSFFLHTCNSNGYPNS